MASNSKAKRISNSEWETHHATIQSLYIAEGKPLGTEGGVIEHMKKHHDFSASKSQYELQFRKWKWRKKLTGAEWRDIVQYTHDNNICLDETSILLDGTALSTDRIRREILRYRSTQSTEASSSLPKGITIVPNQGNSISPHRPTSQSTQTQLLVYQSPQQSPMFSFGSPELLPKTLFPDTFSRNNIEMRLDGPYSWFRNLDFNKLPKSMLSAQQLSTWRYHPASFQLDPTFSAIENVFNTLAIADVRVKLPTYLITSLLNQSSPPDCPTADQAYAWLKKIPGSAVQGLLADLPMPVLDALREPIFTYAIDSGDALIAEDMLKLGISPHGAIGRDYESLLSPLKFSLVKGHALVTKVIFAHMCQDATPTDINRYLTQYLSDYKNRTFRKREHSIATHVEIVCMALTAGAQPTTEVMIVADNDLDLIKQILEAGEVSLEAWLHAGLIQKCLYQDKMEGYRGKVTEKVISYIFRERFDDLVAGTPVLRTTLIKVIEAAARQKHTWVVESVLQAFHRLKFRLDDPNNPQDTFDHSIIDACYHQDWIEAALLLLDGRHHFSKPQPKPIQKPQPNPMSLECFWNAVRLDDQESVFKTLKNQDFCMRLGLPRVLYHSTRELSQTIGLANDRMAVRIIQVLEDTVGKHWGIMPLLESSRTAVISALLKESLLWNEALRAAKDIGDFSPLENAVYSHIGGQPYMEVCKDTFSQQMSLRLLAYHATETGDEALYR